MKTLSLTILALTAAAYQHFESADLNRDGKLTGEERMQAHRKMRAAQRPRR